MEILRQLISVASVFGLLALTLWWLKRRGQIRIPLGGHRGRGHGMLEKLERLSLSPQHTLHLVRVGDRTVLLMIHASGCTLLESSSAPLHAARRDAASTVVSSIAGGQS